MKKRLLRIRRSFKYAGSGISHAFLTQPNLWVHVLIAVIVCFLAVLTDFNYIEWILLVIVIGIVLTLEMVNTVAEIIVDLASPEFSEYARIAKNVSAGAVLIAAITSVLTGLILFGQKLF